MKKLFYLHQFEYKHSVFKCFLEKHSSEHTGNILFAKLSMEELCIPLLANVNLRSDVKQRIELFCF